MWQRFSVVMVGVVLMFVTSSTALAAAWWPGQACDRGASLFGFGWCDTEFAPDGSYTHCEYGWLGIQNCWRVYP